MIKASELRIGNCILYLNELYIVDGIRYEKEAPESKWRISFRTVDDNNPAKQILRNGKFENWIDPIPLTPEILEKCGFYKSHLGGYWKSGQRLDINAESISYCLYENFNEVLRSKKLQYLHQLQNLYFALTGSELIVSL